MIYIPSCMVIPYHNLFTEELQRRGYVRKDIEEYFHSDVTFVNIKLTRKIILIDILSLISRYVQFDKGM